ncbi:autism susceptibility gene 2 protein homolog [Nerophis ophidion]|uniref:autism susceptibility gene 2 protein homolog n=1 Tax=Nerophis ophidion TaxID=159077 RepID=UPI002ADFD33A|nr:autism susceptibility gene 2 protein homolog [Nerophis ophidion]
MKDMGGPPHAGLRKKRKSRSERTRERTSKWISNDHVKGSVFHLSSDSEREGGRNPSSSRPKPLRRKRKESTSAEDDIIDGFSIVGFVTLTDMENNLTTKAQQRSLNQAGPLHKSKSATVSNGRILESDMYNNHYHHHQASDQENTPNVFYTQGKRKKKHLSKRSTKLKPGQNQSKNSDSGESKPSIRSSSRDRTTDCDTESENDKVRLTFIQNNITCFICDIKQQEAGGDVQQLCTAIENKWTNIPQPSINNLISSMQKRCVSLGEAKGGYTRY